MATPTPTSEPRNSLPPGVKIDNFRITRLLGKGGFSLIYLAIDEESGDEVVIKEYLPKKLARRDLSYRIQPTDPKNLERLYRGRKLFFQEVKTLASLHHPNIVEVAGLFLANDTAYLVMQYERGKNLGSYIQERRTGLSTSFILNVFLPILDALALLHSRALLHLDVKPGNIHLRHGNDPILLDFGAVHSLSQGRTPRGQVITAGYSPVEQYYHGGNIGPWTDVYAVGASIRTCMECRPPPPSVDRHGENKMKPAKTLFRDRYPLPLLEAVDWAMEMEPENRPHDAGELYRTLLEHASELPMSRFPDSRQTSSPSKLFTP